MSAVSQRFRHTKNSFSLGSCPAKSTRETNDILKLTDERPPGRKRFISDFYLANNQKREQATKEQIMEYDVEYSPDVNLEPSVVVCGALQFTMGQYLT